MNKSLPPAETSFDRTQHTFLQKVIQHTVVARIAFDCYRFAAARGGQSTAAADTYIS